MPWCFICLGTVPRRLENTKLGAQHGRNMDTTSLLFSSSQELSMRIFEVCNPQPSLLIKTGFSLGAFVATSLAFYKSQKGLSLENSEKSLKRGSRGLSAPGSKRPQKESKMTVFQVFFEFSACFQLCFDFFWALSTPGPGGPGNLFSDFFRSFLGRGRFDSWRRPTMSQGFCALKSPQLTWNCQRLSEIAQICLKLPEIARKEASKHVTQKRLGILGGQNLYTNTARRGPSETPWRLFGVYAFSFFSPWKQAFWYTPNLFLTCWGTWVFKAENTFGVYLFLPFKSKDLNIRKESASEMRGGFCLNYHISSSVMKNAFNFSVPSVSAIGN